MLVCLALLVAIGLGIYMVYRATVRNVERRLGIG